MDNIKHDIAALESQVSLILDRKRFIHTIGVKDMSFALSLVHGCDDEKAVLAGLLHDCAKCLSDEILLSECEKHNITISKWERKAPYLLHGKLGAYYAKTKYFVNDEDILNGITYHTTGRPNMSLLEKIVFVADYIEPGRSSLGIPGLTDIRILSFKDLDRALLTILENTIGYLNKKAYVIDTTTLDAYNYYKQEFLI